MKLRAHNLKNMMSDEYFTLLKEQILQITDISFVTPLICQIMLQLNLILCNPIHTAVIQRAINIISLFRKSLVCYSNLNNAYVLISVYYFLHN